MVFHERSPQRHIPVLEIKLLKAADGTVTPSYGAQSHSRQTTGYRRSPEL